jgi:hypothetical protein
LLKLRLSTAIGGQRWSKEITPLQICHDAKGFCY